MYLKYTFLFKSLLKRLHGHNLNFNKIKKINSGIKMNIILNLVVITSAINCVASAVNYPFTRSFKNSNLTFRSDGML